jgi:hypothetical protein
MTCRTLSLVATGILALPLVTFGQTELAAIMRDEYALGLTPTARSAGMGGASLGLQGAGSMNPAALAWAGRSIAATYGSYSHDAGPDAQRGRLDATIQVPKIGGTARLMLDAVDSDGSDASLLGGAPLEYESTTLGLQYGRQITERLAIGFGAYPYEEAVVDMTTPGGTMSGEGFSQVGSIQLGALGRIHEKVNVGFQYIHIIDELKLEMPGGANMEDDFEIDYLAAGLAVMPFEGTLILVDYWYGDVDGMSAPGRRFDADIDRWSVGIEQRVLDPLDLRIGTNNDGLSAGFTLRLGDVAALDYAYIDEALKDKEEIFGETEQHTVSISCAF